MPKRHSKIIIKKFHVISNPKLTFVGECDKKKHYYEIAPGQTDKQCFLTHYHEQTHLLMPDLEEADIVKIEKLHGEHLWKVISKMRRKWVNEAIQWAKHN